MRAQGAISGEADVALAAAEAAAIAEEERQAKLDAAAAERAQTIDEVVDATMADDIDTIDELSNGAQAPQPVVSEAKTVAASIPEPEGERDPRATGPPTMMSGSKSEIVLSKTQLAKATEERRAAERKAWRAAARQSRAARAAGTIVTSGNSSSAATVAGSTVRPVQSNTPADTKAETALCDLSAKEVRRDGFALAEKRYLECLPELREFEALARAAEEEHDEDICYASRPADPQPQSKGSKRGRR